MDKLLISQTFNHQQFKNNGGEQEIRTLDAFRHTHFPGVLLRPLGQLTKTDQYAPRNECAYISDGELFLQPIFLELLLKINPLPILVCQPALAQAMV